MTKTAVPLLVILLLLVQPTVLCASSIGKAVLSPDGAIVADPQEDDTVILRDVASGNKIATLDLERHLGGLPGTHSVLLSFSPDSKLLATQRSVEQIVLWNVRDGRKLATPSRRYSNVFTLQFSVDSRLILSAGYDCIGPSFCPTMITVWEVATRNELFHVDLGVNTGLERATFSPDGKTVMAYLGHGLIGGGGEDKLHMYGIKLWDIQRAKELTTLKATRATSASFSPDGRFLLITEPGLTPKILDIRSGKMRPLGEGIGSAGQRSTYSGPMPRVITAANVAESIGNNKWNWTVFIKGDPKEIDRVARVQYTLHPSFAKPVRLVSDRGDLKRPFGLSATGWGTFDVGIRVFMKDGSRKDLKHKLKF